MSLRFPGLISILLSVTLILTACESSEERAQKHYESGLALLKEGDVVRAMVEFRNVLQLNPTHKDARLTIARTQLENGDRQSAFGSYAVLVENYPENVEGHVELSEIAFLERDLETASRHGLTAKELEADNQRATIVVGAIDYINARKSGDEAKAAEIAAVVSEYLAMSPSNQIARQVVIEQLISVGDFDKAMPAIDKGLEFEPDDFQLLMAKMRLQVQENNLAGVEETLIRLVAEFPENEELQRMLFAFYLENDNLDGAEEYLRELADAPDAEAGAKMVIVQFLSQYRGIEAARAELNRLIGTGEDNFAFRVMLASMDYEEGKKDQALAEIEALLVDAEPNEETRNTKVLLARMLIDTGNPVGARARVEEVLSVDAGHAEALKLQAVWLTEEDKPGEAIVALRTALASAPQDAEIMTLMGLAHERAGARELAGERYAVAVDVSGSAIPESLRYAAFLAVDERFDAAIAVLQKALERAPQSIDLQSNLAFMYIRERDWNRATRIVWSLRAMETDAATAAANRIETEVLSRQERTEDTIAFLEGLIEDGDNDAATLMALLQNQVRDGRLDAATELMDERLADDPENPELRFLRAGLYTLSDEADKAEAEYRQLLEEFPGNDRILSTLYSRLIANGRDDDANALVEETLAQNPDARAALLIKASRLEGDKDFEGAIEIYERLYATDSSNLVLANNLASLITTHRNDEEGLDRAFAIASRLRGTDVPPFQDTYGWIEYRRGNYEEALAYLEPAAEGLSEDPFVQYHLAMTYIALERVEDARAALNRMMDLESDSDLPQFVSAREELAKLPPAQ